MGKAKKRSKTDTNTDDSESLSQCTLPQFLHNTPSTPRSATDTDTNMDVFMSKLRKEIVSEVSKQVIEQVTHNITKNITDKLENLIVSLQIENERISKELERAKQQLTETQEENRRIKELVYSTRKVNNDLEQYSRRNSIRVFGIQEERGEENCEVKVLELVNTKLGVDMICQEDIDACHRVGRPNVYNNRGRAIIVKFLSRKKT